MSLLKEIQRIKNTSKKISPSYLILDSTIYFHQGNGTHKQPSKITSFKKLEAKQQAKQKPYSFRTNGYLDPGKEARKSRSLNPKPFPPKWSMGPSMGPFMGPFMGPSIGPFMGPSMNWTLNS